jgi:hypothetical protein
VGVRDNDEEGKSSSRINGVEMGRGKEKERKGKGREVWNGRDFDSE